MYLTFGSHEPRKVNSLCQEPYLCIQAQWPFFPASAHMITVIETWYGTTTTWYLSNWARVTVRPKKLPMAINLIHNCPIYHIAIVHVQLHVQSNTYGPQPVLPPFLYISGYIPPSVRDSSLCIADTSTWNIGTTQVDPGVPHLASRRGSPCTCRSMCLPHWSHSALVPMQRLSAYHKPRVIWSFHLDEWFHYEY